MTKEYKLHDFEGIQVVLTPTRKAVDPYPEANFDGTGWALCGRLLKGETIEEFAVRASEAHVLHNAENTDSALQKDRRIADKIERVMKLKNEKEL